jgi:hypothetical protein
MVSAFVSITSTPAVPEIHIPQPMQPSKNYENSVGASPQTPPQPPPSPAPFYGPQIHLEILNISHQIQHTRAEETDEERQAKRLKTK